MRFLILECESDLDHPRLILDRYLQTILFNEHGDIMQLWNVPFQRPITADCQVVFAPMFRH
jgi:hypothetical protein